MEVRLADLVVKPAYEILLRPLSDDEYSRLGESMEKYGQLDPIKINQHKEILDGHHRAKKANELGWDKLEATEYRFETEEEARIFIRMTAMDERILTNKELAELIAEQAKDYHLLAKIEKESRYPQKGEKDFKRRSSESPNLDSHWQGGDVVRELTKDRPIGRTTVYKAKAVKDHITEHPEDTEIKEMWEDEETSVHAVHQRLLEKKRDSSVVSRVIKERQEIEEVKFDPSDEAGRSFREYMEILDKLWRIEPERVLRYWRVDWVDLFVEKLQESRQRLEEYEIAIVGGVLVETNE